MQDYRQDTGDLTPAIIDATANPYKLSRAVLASLKERVKGEDEYRNIERLQEITGVKTHHNLTGLEDKEIKHHRQFNVKNVPAEIRDILF